MARIMYDTTEVYRAEVRYANVTCYYGPYEGPAGKGQAKRRTRDQARPGLIESKVQKLDVVWDDIRDAYLGWVDVDD